MRQHLTPWVVHTGWYESNWSRSRSYRKWISWWGFISILVICTSLDSLTSQRISEDAHSSKTTREEASVFFGSVVGMVAVCSSPPAFLYKREIKLYVCILERSGVHCSVVLYSALTQRTKREARQGEFQMLENKSSVLFYLTINVET